MAHQAGVYPGLMKRLGVFLLPRGEWRVYRLSHVQPKSQRAWKMNLARSAGKREEAATTTNLGFIFN